MAKVKRGKLRSIRPKGIEIEFEFNPTSVREEPSVGGWSEIARPNRKPAVEWIGRPAERISFPLRFDGFPGESVERRCNLLESLGRPRAPGKRPPILQFLYGPGNRQKEWVLESAVPRDGELRRADLERVRAEYDVVLLQFIEGEVALTPTQKQKEKKDKKKGKKRTVAERETLTSIAATELGDATRWGEIAELNGIRDPLNVSAGQVIDLPES